MHGDPKSSSGQEDLFKVQDRPMDFNITEYEKSISVISNSTLQLILKKLPLLFWNSIKAEYA